MAIHNSVFLYGKVLVEPKIIKNEQGENMRAMFSMSVIRNNKRKTGNEDEPIVYDTPIIFSQNPDIIKTIELIKPNDIIQLKGVLVTKNVKKGTICPCCQTKNMIDGVRGLINPIYLKIIKQNNTSDEAFDLLRESQEVSNTCTIIGTVCNQPELYISPKGVKTTQYQLAINRKYKIKEDPPEIRTDYPWVKSYGELAEMDNVCLQQGSLVFIDGFLQTRSFLRTFNCCNEDCNELLEWKDNAVEIIPYQTEFLNNFTTPEEKEIEDKLEVENLLKNDL